MSPSRRIQTPDGVTFELGEGSAPATWISGPTLDPQNYDRRHRQMWARLDQLAEAGFPGGVPQPAPGSAPFECSQGCGVQVAIGPGQQAVRAADPDAYAVVCYLCIVEAASSIGGPAKNITFTNLP